MSFKLLIILTSIKLIYSFTSDQLVEELPEYTCAQAGSRCSLYNVNLTKENYRYLINAEDPVYVNGITFELSNIPYFTAEDLCSTFKYLFEIRAEYVGMEEIDGAALEKCNYLTNLELNHNRIKVIPDTLFTRPFPQFVQLANNKISKINTDTFASLELELLDIAGNDLDVFPVEAFKNAKLRWLFIQSNELLDLDVEKLLLKFPRFPEGRLIYGGNNIACSRMQEINYLLKRYNVDYQPIEGFDPYYPKMRYYDEAEVEGLPCIPEKAYGSMFYRKLALDYKGSKTSSTAERHRILKDDISFLVNSIEEMKRKNGK